MDKLPNVVLTTALSFAIATFSVFSMQTAEAAGKKGKKSVKQANHAHTKKTKKIHYAKRKRTSRTGGGCQTLNRPTLHQKAAQFKGTVHSASRQHHVNPNLINAVITIESCFNSRARGSSGEQGLMQLMPSTARRFGVNNGYNVWQNVNGGTRYLSYLLKRYRGLTPRAVAAYNAGEGNVKHTGPIRNQAYVTKVMTAYNKFTGATFYKDLNIPQPKRKQKPREEDGLTLAYKETFNSTLKRRAKTRGSRLAHQPLQLAQVQTDTSTPWVDHLLWDNNSQHARKQIQGNQRAFRSLNARFHHVKAGETLYGIAKAKGMSVMRLQQLNGLSDQNLSAGHLIQIR